MDYLLGDFLRWFFSYPGLLKAVFVIVLSMVLLVTVLSLGRRFGR